MNNPNNRQAEIKVMVRKTPQNFTDGSVPLKRCFIKNARSSHFLIFQTLFWVFTNISVSSGFPTQGLDRIRFMQRNSSNKSIQRFTSDKFTDRAEPYNAGISSARFVLITAVVSFGLSL